MKLKELATTTGWMFAAACLVGTLVTGVYLINVASATVEPPDDDELKVALKVRKKQKSSPGTMRPRRTPTSKKPTARKTLKGSTKRLSLTKGRSKAQLNAIMGLSMPGSGNQPLKLKGKEENARSKEEYDAIKKERRLKRDKRRYDRMDDRISRLQQRLEALQNDGTKKAQASRLEKSIERLKNRKKELQKRLKEAGELD